MEVAIESIDVTTRRPLSAGLLFKVKRGSGPYSQHTRNVARAPYGDYRALRLFYDSRRPKRIYCDAIELKSERRFTLYVQGPVFKSNCLSGVINRPYEIELLPWSRQLVALREGEQRSKAELRKTVARNDRLVGEIEQLLAAK